MQDHAGTVIGDHREAAVRAALHQPGDRRQLVAPALEDERRLGAVEPDEHDLPRHGRSVARLTVHLAGVGPPRRQHPRGGGHMSKKRLLAAAFCAAAVAGLSAASCARRRGDRERQGHTGPAHANSICSFSGQNDDPSGTQGEGPGGRTQSYGQDVRNGFISPHEFNPGDACRREQLSRDT